VPTVVEREEVLRLQAEEAAQIVEVLPRAEYDEEHLPGAVSLPLKELNAFTKWRVPRDPDFDPVKDHPLFTDLY